MSQALISVLDRLAIPTIYNVNTGNLVCFRGAKRRLPSFVGQLYIIRWDAGHVSPLIGPLELIVCAMLQKLFNGGFPMPKPRLPSRLGRLATQTPPLQAACPQPLTHPKQTVEDSAADVVVDIVSVSEADEAAAAAWKQHQLLHPEPFLIAEQLLGSGRGVSPSASAQPGGNVSSQGLAALAHLPAAAAPKCPAAAVQPATAAPNDSATDQSAGSSQPSATVSPAGSLKSPAAAQSTVCTQPDDSPMPPSLASPTIAVEPVGSSTSAVAVQPACSSLPATTVLPATTHAPQASHANQALPAPLSPCVAAQPTQGVPSQSAAPHLSPTSAVHPDHSQLAPTLCAACKALAAQQASPPVSAPGDPVLPRQPAADTQAAGSSFVIGTEPLASVPLVLHQQHGFLGAPTQRQQPHPNKQPASVQQATQQELQVAAEIQQLQVAQSQAVSAAQPSPDVPAGALSKAQSSMHIGLQQATQEALPVPSPSPLPAQLQLAQPKLLSPWQPQVQAAAQADLLLASDPQEEPPAVGSALQPEDQSELQSKAQRKLLLSVQAEAPPCLDLHMPQRPVHTPSQEPSNAAVQHEPIVADNVRKHSVPLQAHLFEQLLPLASAGVPHVSQYKAILAAREARNKQLAELANVTHSPKRNLRAWKTVLADMSE